MENPQIKIDRIQEGLNYCRYQIEPLEPGYGTTLGNALRRILLRSLEGVAVTRIRIDNVWHEFSSLDHVREDVTEIVLNVKQVRLKRMTEMNGEIRAFLYARGDGTERRIVTAGDVEWPSEVEVINPDQPIATIESPDAQLDMDLWISRGRGYRAAEMTEATSLGEIAIDAVFAPIQRVNFVIEHTRVGQQTDYDRLLLEILTDGTIEPDDALSEAAEILMDHARVFVEFNRKDRETGASTTPIISDEVQSKPLNELGLSPRVLNALRSRSIERVGQVLTMDPDQLLSIRNFGPRSLNELKDKLAEAGYLPEGDVPVFDTSRWAGAVDDSLDDPDSRDVVDALASLRGDDHPPDEADEEQNA